MITLPPALEKVFRAFSLDTDVPFIQVYRIVCPEDTTPDKKLKNVQQRIGPYISRINRRIGSHKMAIVPGVARRTYRLVCIKRR